MRGKSKNITYNKVNHNEGFEIVCRVGHKSHSMHSEDKTINLVVDLLIALGISSEEDKKATNRILKDMTEVMIARNQFIKQSKENTDYIRTQCVDLIKKLNTLGKLEEVSFNHKKELEKLELNLHNRLDKDIEKLSESYNKVEHLLISIKKLMLEG